MTSRLSSSIAAALRTLTARRVKSSLSVIEEPFGVSRWREKKKPGRHPFKCQLRPEARAGFSAFAASQDAQRAPERRPAVPDNIERAPPCQAIARKTQPVASRTGNSPAFFKTVRSFGFSRSRNLPCCRSKWFTSSAAILPFRALSFLTCSAARARSRLPPPGLGTCARGLRSCRSTSTFIPNSPAESFRSSFMPPPAWLPFATLAAGRPGCARSSGRPPSRTSMFPLDNLQGKFYHLPMARLKATPQVRRFLQKLASEGGKARAAKYDKATLRKWAKLGGRPAKARKGAPK